MQPERFQINFGARTLSTRISGSTHKLRCVRSRLAGVVYCLQDISYFAAYPAQVANLVRVQAKHHAMHRRMGRRHVPLLSRTTAWHKIFAYSLNHLHYYWIFSEQLIHQMLSHGNLHFNQAFCKLFVIFEASPSWHIVIKTLRENNQSTDCPNINIISFFVVGKICFGALCRYTLLSFYENGQEKRRKTMFGGECIIADSFSTNF